PSLGAVAKARSVIHELIDAGIKKSHELNLADRPQPLHRHADTQAADEKLGERRVDDALGPESLLQTHGGAEHAAVHTDVLAEHNHILVALHGAREREIDGFDQSCFSHGSSL